MKDIDSNALAIIKKINSFGYEAFLVGGCVRDLFFDRNPKDWDITTSAKPEEVMEIFNDEKIIPTGLKHGTVTVVLNNNEYEITTYRIDGEYIDNRHPESVEFTSDINKDLSRRDLTINAMAYDGKTLIDPFNGIVDLSKKIIQTVNNPDERFNEDALRMLRAIRFSATLEFDIDMVTQKSILRNASLIKNISQERIYSELNKILISDNPGYIKKVYELGLIDYIIPEFSLCFQTKQNSPFHMYDVGNHIVETIKETNNDSIIRWAALFHDIGKPDVRYYSELKKRDTFLLHEISSYDKSIAIMKRLKFSSKDINDISFLVLNHMRMSPSFKSVKKFILNSGKNHLLFYKLMDLQKAGLLAHRMTDEMILKLDNLKLIEGFYKKIISGPHNIKDLAINGNDLLETEIPAKYFSLVLNNCLSVVISSPELNNKDFLVKNSYRAYNQKVRLSQTIKKEE